MLGFSPFLRKPRRLVLPFLSLCSSMVGVLGVADASRTRRLGGQGQTTCRCEGSRGVGTCIEAGIVSWIDLRSRIV